MIRKKYNWNFLTQVSGLTLALVCKQRLAAMAGHKRRVIMLANCHAHTRPQRSLTWFSFNSDSPAPGFGPPWNSWLIQISKIIQPYVFEIATTSATAQWTWRYHWVQQRARLRWQGPQWPTSWWQRVNPPRLIRKESRFQIKGGELLPKNYKVYHSRILMPTFCVSPPRRQWNPSLTQGI